MSEIEHMPFVAQITPANVREFIANKDRVTISNFDIARLCGCFADYFRDIAVSEKQKNGDSDIARIYSHAENVFGEINGQNALQHKAEEHQNLLCMLYLREESFALFVDKFLPDLLIVGNQSHVQQSSPPEVAEGKIVQFQR